MAQDKIALIKKHNLSLRLVLFFPIPLLFNRLPTILFIRQRNTRNYSTLISEMFFTFLREKLF